MSDLSTELAANAGRFRGSLDDYDQFRPSPPPILTEILDQFAGIRRPSFVVDLGCGTGLSTRFWSDKAQRVIGIDPSAQMISVAQGKAPANTTHKLGFSHETGLDANSADIVTCCQSLHWMAPDKTIVEVARILRPGGMWLAVDYDVPLVHWELDLAVKTCLQKAKAKAAQLKLHKEEKAWTGDQSERIDSSGRFRFTREFSVNTSDSGDAARLLGFVRSLGTVQMPLQHCQNDAELGLDLLEQTARQILNEKSVWHWGYRLILALK